jgi:hypothetical protein
METTKRLELLKLKFDMIYRGLKRENAEPRFTQIVSVTPTSVSVASTK